MFVIERRGRHSLTSRGKQMRWYGYLTIMQPRRLPGEAFMDMSNWEKTLYQTLHTLCSFGPFREIRSGHFFFNTSLKLHYFGAKNKHADILQIFYASLFKTICGFLLFVNELHILYSGSKLPFF